MHKITNIKVARYRKQEVANNIHAFLQLLFLFHCTFTCRVLMNVI